jgi:hypothetical protein
MACIEDGTKSSKKIKHKTDRAMDKTQILHQTPLQAVSVAGLVKCPCYQKCLILSVRKLKWFIGRETALYSSYAVEAKRKMQFEPRRGKSKIQK